MGAAAGEVRSKDLKGRNALQVHDAVTVSWLPGAHQPRIGHLRRETSAAAARGSVLGGLVDLIFLAPAAEAEAGPGVAALARRLRGTGIDQTFLEEIKAQLSLRPRRWSCYRATPTLTGSAPSSSAAWRAATSSSCMPCSPTTLQKC